MQQQDVARVLSDPLAQELMQSSIPARLAYVGPDGFPRAIPIGFHWNGAEFVLCTVPDAPKVPALKANPKVALTVDTNAFPPHVLLVRGTAAVDIIYGIPPEYLAACVAAAMRERPDLVLLTGDFVTRKPRDFVNVTEILAPLAWFPRLQNASRKARGNWRLIGGGVGIHWEEIDEDISVERLLAK